MSELLIYLGKVSLISSLLCLTYYFFHRKLSFHVLNRILLLAIIPFSLLLPFIQLDIEQTAELRILQVSSGEEIKVLDSKGAEIQLPTPGYGIGFYLELIYYLGLLISIGRILLAGVNIFRQIKTATPRKWEKYRLIRVSTHSVYSFYAWIFLPQNFDLHKNKDILKHEAAHLELKHSYDLLITEFFLAFCWFNPFAYLFRQMLKSLHEFQADEAVLSTNIKKSAYLGVLLSNSLESFEGRLSSSFQTYSMKARIEMISKRKDSLIHSSRYLFLLPLILLLLLAFAKNQKSKSFLFPIQSGLYQKIVAPFGARLKDPFTHTYRQHQGIDILAAFQTPIRASASGTVIRADHDKSWGNIVIMDHGDGYESRYAHMSDIKVEVGEEIQTGEIIGHLGSSGLSPNPHLHYEVRKEGRGIHP
ncbi:MAG: peptidoglycan DD-metalloendopeptidase family protein [Bacteroidia bacterium]|nr:peptidoglycan DD-metalloendopeptidase family protein [Bacteroidia bacterium]